MYPELPETQDDIDRAVLFVGRLVLTALATVAGGVLLGIVLAWRGM